MKFMVVMLTLNPSILSPSLYPGHKVSSPPTPSRHYTRNQAVILLSQAVRVRIQAQLLRGQPRRLPVLALLLGGRAHHRQAVILGSQAVILGSQAVRVRIQAQLLHGQHRRLPVQALLLGGRAHHRLPRAHLLPSSTLDSSQ